MLSNRPYLVRAFYQWIIDSACTPILVIDANYPHCKIPQDYAEGGEIVFNISPAAVRDLKINNDLIEFKASFSGVIHMISAPVKAILAIYAEENGEGLFLDAEEDTGDSDNGTDDIVPFKTIEGTINRPLEIIDNPTRRKPVLKLVE